MFDSGDFLNYVVLVVVFGILVYMSVVVGDGENNNVDMVILLMVMSNLIVGSLFFVNLMGLLMVVEI